MKRQTGSAQRYDIQGLRALAVLAVIGVHLYGWPHGGFVGVDIFFVISGYLITGLLLREHERTGSISYTGFYVRRAKRILPAALLVLAATTIASDFLIKGTRAATERTDAVWSLFFAGNWRFAIQSTDYFQQDLLPSPLQHFWSLGVEEQFYLVWPWLMLAVLALTVARVRRSERDGRNAVIACIAVITIASFVWSIHETGSDPTYAYFSTFDRAWELGVGALIATLGFAWARIRSVPLRTGLAWVGLAGIVASVFVVPESPGFPAPWGLLPVLSTGLVIAAGHGVQQPHLWPLTNRASRYVGDISYSLYLWHFPVAVLLVALLPSNSFRYYAFGTLLIAGLAVFSYHLVENPLRTSAWRPRRQSSPRRVPGGALLAGTGLLVALVCVLALRSTPAPVAANYTPAALAGTSGEIPSRCFGAAYMDPTHHCTPGQAPEGVQPTAATMENDTQDAFDCWIEKHAPMRTCSYGSTKSGALKVALVGDSHAAMLLPALQPHLIENNWHLDTYLGWGCEWTPTGAGSSCDQAMASIQQRLETGARYDLIIVSGARQNTGHDKARVSSAMSNAWRPVAARGTKIVVVGDNPSVSKTTLECVQQVGFDPRKTTCETSRTDALSEIDAEINAVRQTPGAKLVDLTSFYCTSTQCPEVIGGVIVYRDMSAHLTATYARTLGPYLVAAVKRAMR